MNVDAWLHSVPPEVVYLLVGLIIGFESLGVPLPGELALVSAALLASQHVVDPVLVALCASTGAIVGDSIGYAIGRRGGPRLLEWAGRRLPGHFGPHHIARAEALFARWGVWAVFFGRFVALLRILAGPLAGALGMPYRRFLAANALGGILWACGTTAVVYWVGVVAEAWLKRVSWGALGMAVAAGVVTIVLLRRRSRAR